MIVGIGLDVCAVDRMQQALDRFGDRFWRRILHPEEREYLAKRKQRAAALAGRFAAKEAMVKALRGAQGVGWHDLEVASARHAPPTFRLHGPAVRIAEAMGVRHVHLSITHDAGVAAAVVVLEAAAPVTPSPEALP